jgi:truncated hemoglobin YjbI
VSSDSEIHQLETTTSTLFDKYGGVKLVVKLVRDFQSEILLRPHLAHYFQGLDLATITEHSILFLSFALGKPAKVNMTREMHDLHSKFHIKGLHFDEISDVRKDTLLADGFSKADVEIVMAHIDTVREIIVCE